MVSDTNTIQKQYGFFTTLADPSPLGLAKYHTFSRFFLRNPSLMYFPGGQHEKLLYCLSPPTSRMRQLLVWASRTCRSETRLPIKNLFLSVIENTKYTISTPNTTFQKALSNVFMFVDDLNSFVSRSNYLGSPEYFTDRFFLLF